MQFLRLSLRSSRLKWIALGAAIVFATPCMAQPEALLLIEADSGKVLQAENATLPWHPASLSKLMTAYVTLTAVKEGRITLDTLLTVSPTAASQSPSKMGLRAGTQVTVDNALKMMLVKSANDMAVVLAEGVGGSIDGFAEQMNAAAQRLGMTQTTYVNPNGLPDDRQVTSARDMAILARSIIRDLPEYEYFVHIPSIRFGKRVTQNFNKLIGRYPGADGFKTGFVCASGYNLIGSATRDGRRLIAVVLGASSGMNRAIRAAQLLDRGFASNGLSFLKPSLGTVENLVPVDAPPVDLHDEMCGPHHKRPATDEDDDTVANNAGASGNPGSGMTFFASGMQPPAMKPSELLAQPAAASDPILVYTGPTRTGAALVAAVATDTDEQTAKHGKRRTHVAAKKPDADDSKPAAAKPAGVKHANAKPDATPKAADTTAPAKPAKPKTAAKPAKPAPKTTGSDKPAT